MSRATSSAKKAGELLGVDRNPHVAVARLEVADDDPVAFVEGNAVLRPVAALDHHDLVVDDDDLLVGVAEVGDRVAAEDWTAPCTQFAPSCVSSLKSAGFVRRVGVQHQRHRHARAASPS